MLKRLCGFVALGLIVSSVSVSAETRSESFNACAEAAVSFNYPYKTASRQCRTAIAQYPDNAELWAMAAMVFRARADHYGEDFSEALQLAEKSASMNNSLGQYILGEMYMRGQGVEQGLTEALHWLRLSVSQGNMYAQFRLAMMYRDGEGVEQNSSEEFRLLKLSADQGYEYSQMTLADMYRFGTDVGQSDTEAIYWLQLAADQGNEHARDALNWMRRNQFETALSEARQGDAEAQFILGGIYADGNVNGVAQNFTIALEWLQKAADQRFFGAEEKIAEVNELYRASLIASLEAKINRLENGGRPTETDIKDALQRKLSGAMGAVDTMGGMCASVGETQNPLAAAACLLTLGGNLNSTSMGMQIQSVTLDICYRMKSGNFICRYNATLKEGSGSHPLMGMLTSLSQIDEYKFASFRTDPDGWYVEQAYDDCTVTEDSVNCKWTE